VHNLRSAFAKMRAGIETRESWATEFDERTASNLQNHDRTGLEQACAGPTGRLAHPSPDHYIPILYAAGAAGRNADVSFPVEGFDMGDISMRAVLFD
jgi:4,5-DOPA dioxygenase extradiol